MVSCTDLRGSYCSQRGEKCWTALHAFACLAAVLAVIGRLLGDHWTIQFVAGHLRSKLGPSVKQVATYADLLLAGRVYHELWRDKDFWGIQLKMANLG